MHIPSTLQEILKRFDQLEFRMNRFQLELTLILRELRLEDKEEKKKKLQAVRMRNIGKAQESVRKNLKKKRLEEAKKA